jgi:HK97 family phage major capsid protein
MASRADDIRMRQKVIDADLASLEAKVNEGPPEDQLEEIGLRTDALTQEWDELDGELKPLAEREAKVAEIRARMAEASNREETTTEPVTVHGGPEVITRTRRDPFADLDSVRTGMTPPGEVRARALAAIEQYANRGDHWALEHDGAEQSTRMVEKMGAQFGTAVARQMLITGSPEYLSAFEQYLIDPGGFSSRAALSLTPANGGYLVPFTLDPTIILTNAGSANPYRQVANIKTTTTNDWNGVTSAGVSAVWTAEGIEASDNSPTVGPLKITPQKATAYLFGSYEVLGDSDFGQQLPGLLADAKDRIEETAFAIGTGTGQPKGVITAGTSQNRAGTAVSGPVAQDVYALQAALPARFRGPNARNVWLGNLNVINSLRNVPKFTGSTESIVNDATDPPRMLGKPFLESTSILGVFTTGNKVLAYLDGRQFYIVDRVGMSVVYDPIVLGSNRIPTGQGAWYAFWRVSSDAAVATAIRVFATLT